MSLGRAAVKRQWTQQRSNVGTDHTEARVIGTIGKKVGRTATANIPRHDRVVDAQRGAVTGENESRLFDKNPAAESAISRCAVESDGAVGNIQRAPQHRHRDTAANGLIPGRAISADRAVVEIDRTTRRKNPASIGAIAQRTVATERAAIDDQIAIIRIQAAARGIISQGAVATDSAVVEKAYTGTSNIPPPRKDSATIGETSRRAVATDYAIGQSQPVANTSRGDPAAISIISRRAVATDCTVGQSHITTRKNPATISKISRRTVPTDCAVGESQIAPPRDTAPTGPITGGPTASHRQPFKLQGLADGCREIEHARVIGQQFVARSSHVSDAH